MAIDLLKLLKTDQMPGPGEFLQIDMQQLAERLELKAKGAERGALKLPGPESRALDDIETEITEAIRTYALAEERRAFSQISLYDQRLQSADPGGIASDMRAVASQSISEFEVEILAAKNELRTSCDNAKIARSDMASFQAKNNLDRPPNPPRGHFFMSMVLVFLLLVETIPNAILLGSGSDEGVLGGYAIAFVASLLNLGAGYVGGRYGWTNAFHVSIVRKLLGLSLAVATIAFIVILNNIVGHARDVVSAGGTASVATVQALALSLNFTFSDALSLGLAIMGVGFALIAMLEGYYWHDPYPGYSEKAKHLRAAEASWTSILEERLTLLNNLQQKHSNELRAARSSLRDKQASIPGVIAERSRLCRSFSLHVRHLESVGRFALSVYRQANRTARPSDCPAPSRFDDEWSLDGINAPNEQSGYSPAPQEDWNEANTALEDSMDRLQSAFRETTQWIAQLDDRMGVHPKISQSPTDGPIQEVITGGRAA